MPQNRREPDNASSSSSSDMVRESLGRLKIRETINQEGDISRSIPYPDRPSEPDCIHYLRTGFCGYGNICRFNHPSAAPQNFASRIDLPQRAGQPNCGYYLKTGTCKYGSSCKYHHPKDRNGAAPVYLNVMGFPMRQDAKSCDYYLRTGFCKFGAECKFHHPQPSLPITSSAGLSYIGGFSTWQLPRASDLSGINVQGQQAYMPLVYSTSPGQEWSTDLGSTGAGAGSSAGVYGSSPAELASCFPDRPDQPDCRYFLNTGTCKYGSNCKYHHPKEKVAQLGNAMNAYTLLPSRPGQAECSNYRLYGLCKFGPTCKFDHPPVAAAGYPYAYGPALPILGPSFFTYAAASPSPLPASSKVSEWIQKTEEATEERHEEAGVAAPRGEAATVDSPPQLSPTNSSEAPPDQPD